MKKYIAMIESTNVVEYKNNEHETETISIVHHIPLEVEDDVEPYQLFELGEPEAYRRVDHRFQKELAAGHYVGVDDMELYDWKEITEVG